MVPRTSQSSVAVRVKWLIGLAQRRISSTASAISCGMVAQLLPLVAVLAESEQAAADRVARGLVPRLHQELAVGDELLLVERLPLDLAPDQLAHQVVPRVAAAVVDEASGSRRAARRGRA